MRTLCDVCESAAAILFCAADEASLCRACDDKVHMCNKLASRHVRVGLAEPNEVPRCDICENAPGKLLHISCFHSSYLKRWRLLFKNTSYVAFFYCEVDGTSLCLQCDMIVHVGGKRTHGRYLLLRQRVEFPGDKMGTGSSENLGEAKREQPSHSPTLGGNENLLNHRVSAEINPGNNYENDGKMENIFIDLNSRPQRTSGQAQGRGNASMDNNYQSESVVPDGYYEREHEK